MTKQEQQTSEEYPFENDGYASFMAGLDYDEAKPEQWKKEWLEAQDDSPF